MYRHLATKIATFGLMLGLSAAASAAELTPLDPPVVYVQSPPVAPVWSWTGFHIGGNAGAAFSELGITDVGNAGHSFATGGAPGQGFSLNNTSFIGGGQAGYDYQLGIGVVGVEGDLGLLGFYGTALDPGTTAITSVGVNDGLYGDVTGRAGFAIGPTLLYAKGGWAFFDGKDTFSTTKAGFVGSTSTGMFDGWTAGAGVEYAMTPDWTLKAEYLHFDFGSQTFNVLAGGTFPFTEKLTVDTVKLGVNYHFGWGWVR